MLNDSFSNTSEKKHFIFKLIPPRSTFAQDMVEA